MDPQIQASIEHMRQSHEAARAAERAETKRQARIVADQIERHLPEFGEIARFFRNHYGPTRYIRVETPDGEFEVRR